MTCSHELERHFLSINKGISSVLLSDHSLRQDIIDKLDEEKTVICDLKSLILKVYSEVTDSHQDAEMTKSVIESLIWSYTQIIYLDKKGK